MQSLVASSDGSTLGSRGQALRNIGPLSSSIAVILDGGSTLAKLQGQPLSDLHIAAQARRLYNHEPVSRRCNRDMRFILSNSPAGDRTRLRRRALNDRYFSNGGPRRAHISLGHLRDVTATGLRRDVCLLLVHVFVDFGRRVGPLLIAFVEIQEGIELRLAGEQLLQPLLVLERAIRL